MSPERSSDGQVQRRGGKVLGLAGAAEVAITLAVSARSDGGALGWGGAPWDGGAPLHSPHPVSEINQSYIPALQHSR